MQDVSDLAALLREDGDKILDASSKLSMSSSLLRRLNQSFATICPQDAFAAPFHVLATSNQFLDNFIDLQFLYDFIQKTLALKIFPDYRTFTEELIDLRLFHNLKLLEVHRLSMNLVRGMKSLRSQLEYMTCMRSVTTLKDILEDCGGDHTQGYVWHELKEAVFSHNNLHVVDASLEFAPWLQSLDLSYNFIRNVEMLNCLSNLRWLNLGNNRVEVLPCFTGQLCNNLQVLILRNNYLENIREIEALINLRELDLGNNCLMEFDYLLALTNLRYLKRVCLEDNPFCFHRDYRVKTARYLHGNVANAGFLLDGEGLNKRELRVVGSCQPVNSLFERSESFNSTATASTVINLDKRKLMSLNHTSDLEASCESIEVTRSPTAGNQMLLGHSTVLEQGMHDSGFVAGPRPASPADSIGSATSLQCDDRITPTLRYSESDIEILSNPSQSSIEVLSSTVLPRCVQSCAMFPHAMKEICKDPDLSKISEELHRSL